MNPNEFRIGNLVEYKGKIYPLIGISPEYPYLDTMEFGVGIVEWKDIKTIQLTEKWLIKLGFEKVGTNGAIEKKNCHLWVYKNGQITMNHEDLQIPVLSVNHIQNLYYALTCEELTINLKP